VTAVPRDAARCASKSESFSEYRWILGQCQQNAQQWCDRGFPTEADTDHFRKMSESGGVGVEWKRPTV